MVRTSRFASWRSPITAPGDRSMVLSDLLAYLRARRGGAFYSDVAEETGIPTLRLVRAERTFTVPDLTADELDRLASYFAVPAEELRAARLQSRGDLTSYLA